MTQRKILQSSNPPILQSSNPPILQSSNPPIFQSSPSDGDISCPSRLPRFTPSSKTRTRLESLGYKPQLNRCWLLRQLQRRFHLPLAHGGHLLLVRRRRRHRGSCLPVANADPGDRDAVGRTGFRGACEPLPSGGGPLPTRQVFRCGPVCVG